MQEKIPEEYFAKNPLVEEKLPDQFFKDTNSLQEFKNVSFNTIGKDDFSSEVLALTRLEIDMHAQEITDLPEDILTPAFYENKILIPLEKIHAVLDTEGNMLRNEIAQLQYGKSTLSLRELDLRFDAVEQRLHALGKRKEYFDTLEAAIKKRYEEILKNFDANAKHIDIGSTFPTDLVDNQN
jgi:hypothetical protein